jgi:hypothetical protein
VATTRHGYNTNVPRTNKNTISRAGILGQSDKVSIGTRLLQRHLRPNLIFLSSAGATFAPALRSQSQGEVNMSGQVILYFDDQADALRFALAAGSVMAGDGTSAPDDLVQETARVTRIKLNAVNGKARQPNPPERVA